MASLAPSASAWFVILCCCRRHRYCRHVYSLEKCLHHSQLHLEIEGLLTCHYFKHLYQSSTVNMV
jgi:hypothetical protein